MNDTSRWTLEEDDLNRAVERVLKRLCQEEAFQGNFQVALQFEGDAVIGIRFDGVKKQQADALQKIIAPYLGNVRHLVQCLGTDAISGSVH